jgi:hypothetical protein
MLCSIMTFVCDLQLYDKYITLIGTVNECNEA